MWTNCNCNDGCETKTIIILHFAKILNTIITKIMENGNRSVRSTNNNTNLVLVKLYTNMLQSRISKFEK